MVEQIPVKDKVRGPNPLAGARVDYPQNSFSYLFLLKKFATLLYRRGII